LEIAEELKRTRGSEFFAHENQRWRGCEQQNGHCGSQRFDRSQQVQALAARTIADLVVVLQEREESRRGQRGARLAARGIVAPWRAFALIGKPLGKTTSETPHRGVDVVRVITVTLAGQYVMHDVVEIVVPLRRVVSRTSIAIACEAPRFVVVVFEHEVNLALAPGTALHRR